MQQPCHRPSSQKNDALKAMARSLREHSRDLLAANARDVERTREAGKAGSFIDRLTLTPERIEAMAKGLEDVAPCLIPLGRRWPTGSGPTGWT
jgi:glutamate-5-semialdehyde dehydrogenase